jgi:hypothetical protein
LTSGSAFVDAGPTIAGDGGNVVNAALSNSGLLPLLSVIAGAVFGIAALCLLALQRFVKNDSGTVEVELPIFGRIKTNYPATAALFGGVFLIWYPQYHTPQSTSACPSAEVPQLTINGTMTLKGKDSSNPVMVGVIPGSIVPADSEGAYSLKVNKTAGSYTGVAFVPGDATTPPYVKVLDIRTDPIKFDHEFGVQAGPHGGAGGPSPMELAAQSTRQ